MNLTHVKKTLFAMVWITENLSSFKMLHKLGGSEGYVIVCDSELAGMVLV